MVTLAETERKLRAVVSRAVEAGIAPHEIQELLRGEIDELDMIDPAGGASTR